MSDARLNITCLTAMVAIIVCASIAACNQSLHPISYEMEVDGKWIQCEDRIASQLCGAVLRCGGQVYRCVNNYREK